MRCWGLVVALAACHARLADPGLAGADGPLPEVDAPTDRTDAPLAADAAQMLGAWSTPAKIPIASSATDSEDDGTLSWGRTEFVWAVQINGTGNKHLFTASYANGVFGTPAPLPFTLAMFDDESPRFSPDDLTLYFASTRGGQSLDIYSSHRSAVGMPWQTPVVVAGPNTAKTEKWYAPCEGGRYLVVGTSAAGDNDLYEGLAGAAPTPATALNSPQTETSAYLSNDCLTAYFASTRGTSTDLYTSHRTSVIAPWDPPTLVAPFDTTDNEEDPWISTDQRTFVFARSPAAGGQKDLYLSTR